MPRDYVPNDPDLKRGGGPPSDSIFLAQVWFKKNVSKKDFLRALNWSENEWRAVIRKVTALLRTPTARTRASFCVGEPSPLIRCREGREIEYCAADEQNMKFWQLNPGDAKNVGYIEMKLVDPLMQLIAELKYVSASPRISSNDFADVHRPSTDDKLALEHTVSDDADGERRVRGNSMKNFLAQRLLRHVAEEMKMHPELRDRMTEEEYLASLHTHNVSRPEGSTKEASRSPRKSKKVWLKAALLSIQQLSGDAEKLMCVRDLMADDVAFPPAFKDYRMTDVRFEKLVAAIAGDSNANQGHFVYTHGNGQKYLVDDDRSLGDVLEEMREERWSPFVLLYEAGEKSEISELSRF